MKKHFSRIAVALIFAMAACFHANAKPHSLMVALHPSDLPKEAQGSSEAMYLHETGAGQTVLYLEQDRGRSLTILDVSDLGALRTLARVSVNARSPYDFVKTLEDAYVLIHYRDGSGFSIMDFKRFKQPRLLQVPQFEHPARAESVELDGLLLTSRAPSEASATDPEIELIDASNPSAQIVLARIKGITQRLDRPETGSTFLLNDSGLTVIRHPAAEQEYKLESTYVN